MVAILNSKKVLVSLVGILVIFVLAVLGKDPELIKWLGGFVASIVSTLNVAQGVADGVSRGATSAAANRAGGIPKSRG